MYVHFLSKSTKILLRSLASSRRFPQRLALPFLVPDNYPLNDYAPKNCPLGDHPPDDRGHWYGCCAPPLHAHPSSSRDVIV
jgi:hypothetical protein